MKPQTKAALYIAKLIGISVLGGVLSGLGAFLIIENFGLQTFFALFVIGYMFSLLKPLYELKVSEYESLDELNKLNGK